MWYGIVFFILLILQIVLYSTAQKPTSLSLLGNSIQALVLLLAAIQFTRLAGRSEKEEIRSHNLLALGFWIWVMGHGLIFYSELLLKKEATGTVTDAIWLIGYCLVAYALFVMLSQLLKTGMIKVMLMLTFAVLFITYATLWPIIIDPDRTILYKIIQVVFPFMDFVIAFLAFLVARTSGDKRWYVAAVGSTIIGIADLIFPYYDILSHPMYRYMDIPLYIGYSMWWLLGSMLVSRERTLDSV